MAISKRESRLRIHKRIRKKVSGTPSKPRVAIFRSNKAIYAQVIDDVNGVTIASASSKDKSIDASSNKVEQSKAVGKLLASKVKAANIENVKFDRGGYLFHGRVKAVADGLREAGLNF
ncbi:MAG: 50S ribosomal protein L18 [Bacteroidota bacterium]